MGVPKFFRWLSERYPLINQRYYVESRLEQQDVLADATSSDSTEDDSNDSESDSDANNISSSSSDSDSDTETLLPSSKKNNKKQGKKKKKNNNNNQEQQSTKNVDHLRSATLAPEIDRLYVDMNGIIHGCSHNNDEDDGSVTDITHAQIFANVCYYLERCVEDIVQPQQLLYLAIDGVAPRAKLNQQRSRRYRSGTTGQEIEYTVWEAHMKSLAEQKQAGKDAEELEQALLEDAALDLNDPGGMLPKFSKKKEEDHDESNSTAGGTVLTEVEPGRFAGKFETKLGVETNNTFHQDGDANGDNLSETLEPPFHSNTITPGTQFFQEFTDHLEAFLQDKVANDPKWQHLTVILSGPNVPGEGEHKIMDFMRDQKLRQDYNPNLRHCIQGQDGDLIMLGLVTHEPNLVLLREQVIFDSKRRVRAAKERPGVQGYVHNPNFEFLHMNVLRDYLAFDFETSNVVADSPFDLERTIDDFVFMTFFVGNDFLPAMPALDIADEAFDLLWYTYRDHRQRWYEDFKKGKTDFDPYLTQAGNIVSGKRLEKFLSEVGSFESTYYDNKKEVEDITNEQIRKSDKKWGTETLPSDDILKSKEEADRAKFREMMMAGGHDDTKTNYENVNSSDGKNFTPVLSSTESFQPRSHGKEDDQLEPGFAQRLSGLLERSVSSKNDATSPDAAIDDQDLKGRYYYDKFQFSPFDAEEHRSLRKAYIEGLVWNLKYYYEGCVSWSWYFPYHYGPMLSDLVDIDEMLEEISFEGRLGEPLKPFEQLMACMPPSQSHMLPEPYRELMTDPSSSIVDFYPQSFTVDMNGKRWPWEAVVLLPFIDTERLLESTAKITDEMLSPEERYRNTQGHAIVLSNPTKDASSLQQDPIISTKWQYADVESSAKCFQPLVKPGTTVPHPGFPTLRSAPIRSMWRRRLGVNVFGQRSRYKTACLEHSEAMPKLPPLSALGQALIGSTIWINYPHLTEAFVTGVSNESHSIRGKSKITKKHSRKEAAAWVARRDQAVSRIERGQGFTGTGGLIVSPHQDVLLTVRPLQGLKELTKGGTAKTFSKTEIEVPVVSTLWAPPQPDQRLVSVPAMLEKDPYKVSEPSARAITTSKVNSPIAKKSKQDNAIDVVQPESEASELVASLLGSPLEPPESKGGSLQLENKQINRRGGGLLLEQDMSLLPKKSSRKDGKASAKDPKKIATKADGEKAFRLFPDSPSYEEVWRPIVDKETKSQFAVLPEKEGRVDGFDVSEESPDNAFKASNGNLWETPPLSKNFVSRQFSSLPQVGTIKPTRRSFGTISSGRHNVTRTIASRKIAVASRPRGRGQLLAAGLAVAAGFFASGADGAGSDVTKFGMPSRSLSRNAPFFTIIRGGDRHSYAPWLEGTQEGEESSVPPLQFAHGTTTLSFVFEGGAIVAVDSRASLGSFVGSKTVQKVLPINSHMIGTMAGGAADCSVLIRNLRSEAMLYELKEGRRISTARVSSILANYLYQNRHMQLSVGTMIVGYDDDGIRGNKAEKDSLPKICYVDNTGTRLEGKMFSAGSGSTFALAILDKELRYDLSEEKAIALGIKAIRYATFRDAFSGGFINVYVVTKDGWKKVFTQDVAASAAKPSSAEAVDP